MVSNKRTYKVSLVIDSALGSGARHGLSKVRLALQCIGFPFEEVDSLAKAHSNMPVIIGLNDKSDTVSEMIKSSGLQMPDIAESLLIKHIDWNNRKALLVSGKDDRGLMYALLDIADRIGWRSDQENPLSEVKDTLEKPEVAERSLSIYTMSRSHFESFFFNEAYWSRYLDMLAQNRFNTFALLFAYGSSGYFAPPYPYFFDVEGFPDIHVVGLTDEQQQRNLDALNRLIEMTHTRGLNFTLGIWDHIYRGGVQQGSGQDLNNPLPGIVLGLIENNLLAYTKSALAKFLSMVPNLDAIQFRMHGESGLKDSEMDEFWENIYQIMKDHGEGIRFDARAKGFPDRLIDKALEMGVNIRICTKYWMEQMGLPFHPTHINPQNQMDRRHSYADLLRYPQRYKMHWRLWNGGTTRVLLWGDPEYARRFAQSTHLYGGEGFEVNEPLATKMASHPHDMPLFELLKPEYRYYDWEFERYWHFFQVFGRIGYNINTPSEVWEKEFEKRFGKFAAPHIICGLHQASKILPRIVAYNYPYDLFPTTRGWIEKQRMEDLPRYAEAIPSDTQQFMSFNEAIKNCLEGTESAKIHPLITSEWFDEVAKSVLGEVDEAEKKIGENKNKEFVSTMVDLKILAHLALYHSRRINAGLSWMLFKHSKDPNALDDAIQYEGQAIAEWQKLVDSAGDIYSDDLMMGLPQAGLSGHWKDELISLQNGLDKLKKQREVLLPSTPEGNLSVKHISISKIKPSNDLPIISHCPITIAPVDKPLKIIAEAKSQSGIKWVRLRYRSLTQLQNFQTIEMVQTGKGDFYEAIVTSENLDPKWDFMYLIEAMGNNGNGKIYPDLEKETPYVVVKLERPNCV